MQIIQNRTGTYLNLMDQEDSEVIQEQYIWLSIILDADYERDDLEQEVDKIIHLNKFKRLPLILCLKG